MKNNQCNPNDFAFENAQNNGLTKREYFAGMALQSTYHQFDNELAVKRMVAQCNKEHITTDQFLSELAVETADALIKALNKQVKNES